MRKDFVPYEIVRDNALKLGWRIAQSGFIPDVIYVSLRGGAYLGNILSEYFKVWRQGDRPVFYAAVVAHSYTDIRRNAAIRVDGWTYSPEYLRSGDKVLLVDDIFDTGRTINHLVNVILERGLPRQDVKVAVHDYKVFADAETLPIFPDYYCRRHEIATREQDLWIHYLSHELIGLTPEERKKWYVRDDPEMAQALSVFER
jgi:hypoxanthine phosphoribosyltransferase